MAALLIVYIKGQYHKDLITLSIIIFLVSSCWIAVNVRTVVNGLIPSVLSATSPTRPTVYCIDWDRDILMRSRCDLKILTWWIYTLF